MGRSSRVASLACAAVCASQAATEGAARAQSHVACVGDSITAGNGTSSAEAAYPAVLQVLLGSSYTVEDDGRPGATMMKSAVPSYWTSREYARSTAWASAGGDVVIQLGTNDSWDANWSHHGSFLADCKELVRHYRALPGQPRVWVSLIPPCCQMHGQVIRHEVVPLLRQCAAESGVPIIDVFGALDGHPEYFADAVHPNDQGAAVIARTVHDALVGAPAPTPAPAPVPVMLAGAFGAVAFALSALLVARASRRA